MIQQTKLLVLLFALLLTSCQMQEQNNKQVESSDFPELLQRSELTQVNKEWDFTQNFYADRINLLKKEPLNNTALLELAELYIKEARVTGEHGHYYPSALEVVGKVLSQEDLDDNTKYQALIIKAGVQLSLHTFQEALDTGLSALSFNDKNAQVYGVLVDCYVELGDYDKAIQMADKMITIKPDIRSYSRISYLRELHGDVDGAIEAMDMAVKSGYPGYEETAWAMLTLGKLYEEYRGTEEAEKIYNAILSQRDNYPFAIAALGDLELKKQNYKEAESMLNNAINIIPEVGYYMSLAQIYKEQDRTEEYDETIKDIFIMLQEDEEAGHIMDLAYIDIYMNLDENLAKARTYLEKEYQLRPQNIEINRLLAEVSLLEGKKEEARDYLKVAESTNSKKPTLLKLNKEIIQES